MLPVWQLADEKRKSSPVRSSLPKTGRSQRRRGSVPPDAANGCEPWVREKDLAAGLQVALAVRIGGVWGSPARLVFRYPDAVFLSPRKAGSGKAAQTMRGPCSTVRLRGRLDELRAGVATAGAVKLLSTQIVSKTGERTCWYNSKSKRREWPCLPNLVRVRAAVLECFPTLRTSNPLRNWRTKGVSGRLCTLLIHCKSKRPRECCSLKNIDCGKQVHHGRKKRPIATETVRPPTNTSRICTSFSSCIAVA